ncbi:MAG TPA: phytoene/squalene synthase family protein [Candidatus Paceibacterota bacterium]|nr:phytoene/squalene synthase family protein [Candidatus Paceibacterota bacterium]
MPSALNDLLKATSRSFYLTLRVLPAHVRPQIGLAYLLARTTDTIADTGLVTPVQRLEALQKLRERILGRSSAPLNFGELAQRQNLSAEKMLLEKVEDSLAALQNFSESDQKLIRAVLTTITSGQELDLKRFAGSAGVPPAVCVVAPQPSSDGATPSVAHETRALPKKIIALQTEAELDDYTYRVAGCVGEFWTKICRAHLFPNAKLDDANMLADGIRFGKGLQLVNILRDLPADLKNGRCYLPVEKLVEAGLTPEDLLPPANESKLRPLYNHYLDVAESHLAAGWKYTNLIPRGQMRVRLACAWPVLIGAKTISRLRDGEVFDPLRRMKIARREVRGIILRSVLSHPFPGAWQKLFVPGGKAVASDAKLT